MVWGANGNGLEAGADQQRQGRRRAARQHQRQWSGPEALGQRAGVIVERDQPAGLFDARDVADQRVEARPILGGEDRGDRTLVGRIGAEAIDGLGRKRDQPAGGDHPRRLGDAGGVGVTEVGRARRVAARVAHVLCGGPLTTKCGFSKPGLA